MRQGRFFRSQITGVLWEREAGAKVAEARLQNTFSVAY